MSWSEAADLAGAILLLLGAFLCLSAAVGLVRFPDVLTRMHAATKPQTLGLLLIVLGVAVSLREPRTLGVLLLVAVLQLMTAPVSAHMVARTAYRSHQVSNGAITTDELAEDLARAGFELRPQPVVEEPSVEVPDDPDEDSGGDEGPRIEVPDHDPGEEPGRAH